MGVKDVFQTSSWVTKLTMAIVVAGIIGWATLVTNASTTSQNENQVKAIVQEQIAGSQTLTRGAQEQIAEIAKTGTLLEQRQIAVEKQLGTMNLLLMQNQRSLVRVETLLESMENK